MSMPLSHISSKTEIRDPKKKTNTLFLKFFERVLSSKSRLRVVRSEINNNRRKSTTVHVSIRIQPTSTAIYTN